MKGKCNKCKQVIDLQGKRFSEGVSKHVANYDVDECWHCEIEKEIDRGVNKADFSVTVIAFIILLIAFCLNHHYTPKNNQIKQTKNTSLVIYQYRHEF